MWKMIKGGGKRNEGDARGNIMRVRGVRADETHTMIRTEELRVLRLL